MIAIPSFTDKEAKVQREEVTCLRRPSSEEELGQDSSQIVRCWKNAVFPPYKSVSPQISGIPPHDRSLAEE